LQIGEGDFALYLPLLDEAAVAAAEADGLPVVAALFGEPPRRRREALVVVEARAEGAAVALRARAPARSGVDFKFWVENRAVATTVEVSQAPCPELLEPRRRAAVPPGARVPLLLEATVGVAVSAAGGGGAAVHEQADASVVGFVVRAGASAVVLPATPAGRSENGVCFLSDGDGDGGGDGGGAGGGAGGNGRGGGGGGGGSRGGGARLAVWMVRRGAACVLCVMDATAGPLDRPPPAAVGAVAAAPREPQRPRAPPSPAGDWRAELALASVTVSLIAAGRELLLLSTESVALELGVSATAGDADADADGGGGGRVAPNRKAVIGLRVGWLEVANQMPAAPFAALLRPTRARGAHGGARGGAPPAPVLEVSMIASAFAAADAAADADGATGAADSASWVVEDARVALADLELAVDATSAAELARAAADLAAAASELLEVAAAVGARAAPHARALGGVRLRLREQVLADELAAATAARASAGAASRACVRRLALEAFAVHLSARSSAVGVAALLRATDALGGGGLLAAEGALGFASRGLLSHLLSVSRAPIAVRALAVADFAGPASALRARVGQHYARCVFDQLGSILGSSDAIGNPRMLLARMERGVADLKKGDGGGLLGNVLGGVSRSASLLTGSLADGVAELGGLGGAGGAGGRAGGASARAAVRNAGDGALSGLESVAGGALGGALGLVLDPIDGARRAGFAGFARGLVTGVTGAIARPLVGAIDAASLVAEGVAASSSAVGGYDDDERRLAGALQERARPPRAFGAHGELIQYAAESALCAALLDGLRRAGGGYDGAPARVERRRERLVGAAADVLVTTQHVLCVDARSGGGGALPRCRWHVPLELVACTEVRGAELVLHLAVAAQSAQPARVVSCASAEEAGALRKLVAQAKGLQNVLVGSAALC
jgi:hypothetical protein